MITAWRKRLVLAWLWWRHTYPFAFAHKPLCSRFAHNTLRFGRIRVCRSCFVLYACAVATALVFLTWKMPASVFLPLFYATFVGVGTLSHPRPYGRLSRPIKDLVRGATGTVLVMMLAFFAYGPAWLGALHLALFAAVYALSLRAYKAQKLHACDGCPELGRGRVCSGFRHQLVLIRAYQRAAERRLGYSET